MNKIYRLKFSKRLNQLVVVSEITTGHDKNSGSSQSVDVNSVAETTKGSGLLKIKPLSALLSLFTLGFAAPTFASGLQGMDVVHGTATMSVNGKNTTITNSPDAIINWKQFNINQDELVRFIQESSNSAVFNRVTSDQVSQLKGTLSSNGQVFLINPNGIFFGKDSVIDTAGFVASTLNIADEDIKRGNLAFAQAKDKAMAEIVNNGLITVAPNGTVALVGGSVKNNGVIKAENGNIFLLAGQKITISDLANPTITYSVSAPENEAVNLGEIFAKGGKINISAGNVKNRGVLNADSIQNKNGKIILSAKEGTADIGGTVTLNGGTISGGSLKITGDKVVIQSDAKFELTGKNGGTVYIGGDERGQGKNGIQLAKETHIKQGATIDASATENGDGGRVVVWGDNAQIDGVIIARGGKTSGNGGFVETSGHYLGVSKTAKVDASAANGKNGLWLLDPYNVRIVAGPQPEESGISRDPLKVTGENAVIHNTTLEAALGTEGTDVLIQTFDPENPDAGSEEGKITVEADIVKNGGGDNKLTFESNSTFTLSDGKNIESKLGALNLNITSGKDTVIGGNIKTNGGNFDLTTATTLTTSNANIDLTGGADAGTFNVNAQGQGQFTNTVFKGKGAINTNVKNDGGREPQDQTILTNATLESVGGALSLTSDLSDAQFLTYGNKFALVLLDKFTAKGEAVNLTGKPISPLNPNGSVNGDVQTSGVNVSANVSAEGSVALNIASSNEGIRLPGPDTKGVVFDSSKDLTINAADNSQINFSSRDAVIIANGSLTLTGNNISIISQIDKPATVTPGPIKLRGNITSSANNTRIVGTGGGMQSNNRNHDFVLNNLTVTAGKTHVEAGKNLEVTGNVTQSGASHLTFVASDALRANKEVNFNGTNSGATLEFQVHNFSNTGGKVNVENYANAKIADSKWGAVNFSGSHGVHFKNNDEASIDLKKNANINAPVTFDKSANISAAILNVSNQVTAADNLNITATTTNVNNGGKLEAADKVTTKGGNLNVAAGGNITSPTGSISIENTGNIDNKGNITTPEGTVTINGANNLTNSGNITAKTDVTVNVNNVTNAGEITSSTAKVAITTAKTLTNTGNIIAKTDAAITAKNANLGGNVTAQDGAVTVEAKEKATVTGNVTGNTGVTTTGKNLEVAQGGKIKAETGDITVNNSGDVTVKNGGEITTKDNGGKIKVEGPANLNVEASGKIVSKTDVEVKAGNVSNAGEITASEGNANITADTKVDNTGNITAKNNANVTAPTANLGGNVTAQDGAVTVDASEKATVSGNVTGKTGVTTTGNNLEVGANGNITSKTGDINVNNTGDVTVKENGKISTLEGTGKISVDKPANLNVEAGGKIVSKTDVEVKAGNVTNAGEITASEGNANITAETKVDNTGNITAKNDVSLQAPDITNSGNVTSNDGKIKVDAA
ncbi:beta strand repeat-containing protein, partial [Ursidibacter arcticus]